MGREEGEEEEEEEKEEERRDCDDGRAFGEKENEFLLRSLTVPPPIGRGEEPTGNDTRPVCPGTI